MVSRVNRAVDVAWDHKTALSSVRKEFIHYHKYTGACIWLHTFICFENMHASIIIICATMLEDVNAPFRAPSLSAVSARWRRVSCHCSSRLALRVCGQRGGAGGRGRSGGNRSRVARRWSRRGCCELL
eukprot:6214782-Pleurochrysis_carterae.AAC.2